MQYKIVISPLTLARRLMIGVLVLVMIGVAVQVGKYGFNYRADWMVMFNLDREINFPTWYSALMLGFCGLLLKMIAAGKKTQYDRYYHHWRLLSVIFWLLAVDEVLSVHELLIIPDLAESLKLPWFLHSLWVIPGAIFVLIFAQQYWKFTLHLPKRSRYHFTLAAMLYIGGALGIEMIGSYYAELEGQQHLTYALLTSLEEAMEMIGTVVFIYSLLFYIGRWNQELQVQIKILEPNNILTPIYRKEK